MLQGTGRMDPYASGGELIWVRMMGLISLAHESKGIPDRF